MAGRIPEYFIDDLLSRTDLVDLIDSHVKLKRAGKNYVACCPFHQEKTPSFTVSPHKQFYYCFGCGASGNALGFLMDFHRLEFVEAVEDLAKLHHLEVPREASAFKTDQAPNKPLLAALDEASQLYRDQLRNPRVRERAISYLKSRGLDGEIANRFQIGFAPAGWDNLISQLGKHHEQQALIDAGLVIKNDRGRVYDRFRDRIMFPIRDQRGRTVAFGGRVLGDDKPKYLNSPESPVFHKSQMLYGLYEAKQANHTIHRFLVVEGYMDVVALAQNGIHYGVATLGTASSSEHLEKLFKHAEEVVFCFDGDAAGRQAAERALDMSLSAMKDGRTIRFLFLPEGEDPDTLVRRQGPEVFEANIEQATPLSDYFFEVAGQSVNLNSLDGKAHMARNAAEKIHKLPKSIFRQLLVDKLSEMTGLSVENIEQAASQQAKAAPQPRPQPANTAPHSPGFDQPGHHQSGYPGTPRRSAAPGFPGKPGFTGKPAPNRQPFDLKRKTANTQVTSLVDAAIRMVLHSPQKAREATIPAELREFESPFIDLLMDMMDLIKERPDISAAGILGRWHARPEGEHLAQLAAREFLVEHENHAEALEQAFQRLLLAKVEADLDTLIAAGATDRAKLKELLDLKKQLS